MDPIENGGEFRTELLDEDSESRNLLKKSSSFGGIPSGAFEYLKEDTDVENENENEKENENENENETATKTEEGLLRISYNSQTKRARRASGPDTVSVSKVTCEPLVCSLFHLPAFSLYLGRPQLTGKF